MSNQIEINAIRSRPRFKVKTTMSREKFTKKLEKHFRAKNKTLGGYVLLQNAVIRLRKDKEKYWAPQLQIRAEEDEDNPNITIIRGFFGPRPSVWTLFLFLYGIGTAIIFFLGMYGIVQMILDDPAPLLWAIPIGVLIVLGTYIAAKTGQRIAKNHISVLRTFVETVLVEEMILTYEDNCKSID